MSYQVLARKWRPQVFADMVGQKHVLQALSNALSSQRLHHAYLFTGTRGVGKTTVARILAKSLNCISGITATPCGSCNNCQAIAQGNFVDLIEVDAASRTRVDDTRELLESIHYAPTTGRFKIYLIDEVHMLSGHSFNALLKTLEEPPAHVKFLLATTDPQKLPITVLSRCLQFNLKRIPPDVIAAYMQELLIKEAITFEKEALKQLSRSADGSMRDGLSLLDQAIGYGEGQVTTSDVAEMLGFIDNDWFYPLIRAAVEGNGKILLETVESMVDQVLDFEAAADMMISILHQIALAQAIPDMAVDDELQALADTLAMENVQLYYQIALHARRDLALAPDPRAGFEMMLLRMMAFRAVKTNGLEATPAQKSSESVNKLSNQNELKKKTVTPPLTHSVANRINNKRLTNDDWYHILPELAISGRSAQLARHAILYQHDNNKIELHLSEASTGLRTKETEIELQKALEHWLGNPVKLTLRFQALTVETPAQREERYQHEKQLSIEESIINDPFVQQLQTQLGAKIVPRSIKARS